MNRDLYFEISKSSTSAYSSINPTSPPSSHSPIILRFHHLPTPPPPPLPPTNLTLYTKTNQPAVPPNLLPQPSTKETEPKGVTTRNLALPPCECWKMGHLMTGIGLNGGMWAGSQGMGRVGQEGEGDKGKTGGRWRMSRRRMSRRRKREGRQIDRFVQNKVK